LCQGIGFLPATAGGVVLPGMVDANRLLAFHAPLMRLDQRIGRLDDVCG